MRSSVLNPRDAISAYTHLAGAILSAIGTVILVIKGAYLIGNSSAKFVGALVFGLSLIALYTASTAYHWYRGSEQSIKMLRKLDHSMIYVLIAGTYTPILLGYMEEKKAIIFTCTMWAVAILGIVIKLFWMNAPRILSTILYIAMGWAIVFDLPAIAGMEPGAFALLLAGGLAYTVGAVIYAIKKPNISKDFGFHELFHVFVMIGSFFQYLVVVLYVI